MTFLFIYLLCAQSLPTQANEGQAVREAGIKISKGESVAEMANKLHSAEIINSKIWFRIYAKLSQADRKIKAGYYVLKKPSSIRDVLRKMILGETSDIKVTIPEGFSLKEIGILLSEKVGVDTAEFFSLVYDTGYIHKFSINASSLEGYLFPETYLIPYGATAKEIIPRFINEFFSVFTDSLRKRAIQMSFSLENVITLASLVEKETSCDSEKPIISGVYYKRLKKGMLLQCDPTVQYVLTSHKTDLSYKDLKVDSKYNTYLYKGLPPGPICSPGKKSIFAALWPQNTPYLYFVSQGKTHIFSKNNKEHNIAKAKAKAIRNNI
ncbi:MAG: endolytic transglycosylase MltG [bacterium]|nr:endolytic transglycosylase MltG [bacterium]